MEYYSLVLFFCLVAPLCMMLFILKGRSRYLMEFLLMGIFMCLFAGEVNALLLSLTGHSMRFLSVNVTPIVEECLKALPVVFVAFLFKPQKQLLLEGAVAVGVGFATMENVYQLFNMVGNISPLLIISRGLGAGLMHSVSTLVVGYMISHITTDRKLAYTGTFAALSVAIIYHSIYNILVQSQYPAVGILLPIITYIPLLLALCPV